MKKILRIIGLVLFFCLVTTHIALADTPASSGGPFATVFDDVLHFTLFTIATIMMGLITLGVNKLREKWHLEVPTAWLGKIHGYVDQGISYAEEQAHKLVDNSEIASNEKLNLALRFVLDFAGDDKKLLALGEEKIKQLIEARLQQLRPSTMFSTSVATLEPATPSIEGIALPATPTRRMTPADAIAAAQAAAVLAPATPTVTTTETATTTVK